VFESPEIRLKRTYFRDDDLRTFGKLGLGRDTAWGGVESQRSRGEGGSRSEERGAEGKGEWEDGRSRRGSSQLRR